MKHFLTATLIALAVLATSAMATPIGTGLNGKIDFRSNIYNVPCNGKTGCTVANVTIKPNPTNTGGLYWDSTDGLGVRGGENDEINYPETLTVTFASSVNLAGIWFTDLFVAPDGGSDGETAKVTLYLGSSNLGSFTFNANEPACRAQSETSHSFAGAARLQLLHSKCSSCIACATKSAFLLPSSFG